MTNTQDLLALWHERGKRIEELQAKWSSSSYKHDLDSKDKRIKELMEALEDALDEMPHGTIIKVRLMKILPDYGR